ncbi:gamma-glutamyltransferase family protein [Nocardia brasiliensis]|uniref:gamma-glutamyltransferase family protein n=1 Tax=Nocardia brasiliensis TaxID=37326 RepID=UPI0018955522|nr:gamma-glutamyltransferase [Nocardia brasiliensis]MBF6125590.1 gamma-glutamyltransferase [Nocardia brasiliensis]
MFTTRPTLQGNFGMVSSTHWLVSATAMAVLEDGGNAFDAAVAAGFVLHLAEPHLNGPAGEVPIMLAPAGQTPRVLCGQGPAPVAATIEHYRDLGFDIMPASGPLAAAVPGAFDAWMLLLRDHGTKPLAQVLSYAIGYAERGVPVVEGTVNAITAVAKLMSTEWPSSAAIYLRDGKPPAPGELVRNPALAATWRRLIAEAEAAGVAREAQIEAARRIWRQGFIAEALAVAATRPALDTSGEPHAGVLNGDDLANYAAHYEDPATYTWNGWTIAKPGLWSQGPVFLQQLALLDELPDYASPEYYHVLIEGSKLALADREAWYGDSTPVCLDTLLSPDYNSRRRTLIGPQACNELRPGSPDGMTPRLADYKHSHLDPAVAAALGAGEPTVGSTGATRGDTCHIDVVDRWGNMVAATPSGGWLQSNPVVPELGFTLNTRLQISCLQPDLPNSLVPGRRPRTTLSPSMAMRDGEVVMAFGTPGGDQQDQWSPHFFLAVALRDKVRGGLDLQGAIDAPNWHQENFPSSFFPRTMNPGVVVVESRIGQDVIDELDRRGHRVTVNGPWTEGRLCAVARDPDTGILSAAASPRIMQGYAAGR